LPSLLSVLQAKDVIDLLPEQSLLQLQLGSQSVITDVRYKDLAYTVHAKGQRLEIIWSVGLVNGLLKLMKINYNKPLSCGREERLKTRRCHRQSLY